MNTEQLSALFQQFIERYPVEEKRAIWQSQSLSFRDFWKHRMMAPGRMELTDAEKDDVIRILDRCAKGNASVSEAVAQTRITQGSWRKPVISHSRR